MGQRSLGTARAEACNIVNGWTAGAAAVSWIPGSTFILGGLDIKMVKDVSKAYEVETCNLEEVVAALAATLAGSAASEMLSVIPILGWAVKAGIAAGVTKAAGDIVIAYFEERTALKLDPGST